MPGFVIGFAGFVTFTDPNDLESAGNRDRTRNDDVPYRNPIYIYMGVKQNVSKIQNLRHLNFEQNARL